LIATETTNDQAQTTQLTTQINTMVAEEQHQQQLLQAEFGQIQAAVASYQSLSELFSGNSNSNSSDGSSSSSSTSPGSNLTVTG